jgi:acyl carrier protein
VIAYAVARGAGAHPNFRSVLVSDDRVRAYPHLTLGIAVHRNQGDLVTAIVPRADTMTLAEIACAVQTKIALVMEGRDQSDETTQVVLTYLGVSQVTHAVPTLVAPAIATLFVGAPAEPGPSGMGRAAALCLTFDHRLINGVEASQFLEAITHAVDQLAAISDSARADLSYERAGGSVAGVPADAPRPASTGDRFARVDALLRDCVVNLLGTPLGASDFRRPLRSLGLTSVMSVALTKGLERDLGIPVPATLVWNYPTIEAITRYLAERLEAHAEPASVPDRPSDEERDLERLLGEVEGLSDAEARRLLTEDEERGGARNG